jgi:FlaG/FlaF family flagellin (archaellin)
MGKLNKRGVSEVIVTVLMVLLVLAAIAILAGVILSFVNRGTDAISGGGEEDCITYQTKITKAEWSDTADTLSVWVQGVGQATPTAVKIVVEADDGTVTINTTSYPVIGPQETKKIATGNIPTNYDGKTVKAIAYIGAAKDKVCGIAGEGTVVAVA